ncbi:MarR family transcriptional regulator [Variovorax humicola]|uniref:MarR family transcriptional regulator n=1 Tax=Variovorax humicola TaxID=1769758 RepID=A0ABU8W753_9BURK
MLQRTNWDRTGANKAEKSSMKHTNEPSALPAPQKGAATRQSKVHAILPPSGYAVEDDLVGRGIKQWKAERPDLDSTGKAVVGRLLRLEEVVLRSINAVLQPYGLKYQEYAVLATLRVSGAPYRLSPSLLQATLLFTSGGLSNLLKRLEREGLIKRSTDPRDGRGVQVRLTAKGHRLVDEAMPKHAAAELHLLRMFDAEQRETLARLLSVMMVGNAPELGPEPG